MGAVFAGAARALITAVIVLFELTGEYSSILPLMLAVVCATATSRALSADTIYTLKLRRVAWTSALPVPRPAPAGRARHGAAAPADRLTPGRRRTTLSYDEAESTCSDS